MKTKRTWPRPWVHVNRRRREARARTRVPVDPPDTDPPTECCHHDPVPRNTTGITVTVPVTVGLRHKHVPEMETRTETDRITV